MVYQAGLLSFLRTILFFIGVYFVFKLVFRYLVPYLLKLFINRQQKKYSSHFSSSNNETGKDGDISIKYESRAKKQKDNLGDYVEYEEVDEQEK